MMKKYLFAFVTVVLVSAPLFAAQQLLFERYEAVRQALLKDDIASVQSTAGELGATARAAKLESLAAHANQLATAATIKEARGGFDVVSQDLIAYRNRVSGMRPVIAYCSMEKKAWLQPTPSPIRNPYLDASMRSCGQIVNGKTEQGHQH